MTLKQDIKSKKLIYGEEVVRRGLLAGKLKKVYISHNFSDKVTIENICKLKKVSLEVVSEDNIQLGVLCKKRFGVSVLGVE
ncbi:ribosomal L7Ae/L30e/S12e/Gadd45 family protein [Candidatus Woesearchaeota archaeon]|nr:ribosomal L7Ae/L30e/S12e/Gadd45 family protein [Candidatus Woesearchaeota archaeon]